jgi:exopolysaccharide biosynthesis polyprenyl glycosylphosphotransferase
MLNKVKTRQDRYRIKEVVCVDKTWEELIDIIDKSEAVMVYDIHSELRNKIVKYCYEKDIRLYITPKISDIILRSSDNIHLFDTPLLLSRNNGFSFEQKFFKRLLDVLVSIVVIVVTAPIMLIIAIAIKLHDGGPVFFKQKRCTLNGEVFEIHKFRSMIVDAEKEGISVPASEKDPRITPVGNVIRATRLDELPQIFDILSGKMSLVGPRPERIEHVEKYTADIPEFAYRLKVKGGLTGYAQIYGKYNTTAYDKIKLDLMYIQNYSILLDLKLILMTIKIIFMKESTEGFDEKQITEIQSREK